MTNEAPNEMSVMDLQALRVNNIPVTVLDVREHNEVAVCHLEPSLHIPMSEIPESLDQLPKDHPLVVLCHHGTRSAQVVNWLHQNGFVNAINLQGGIDQWAQVVDPSTARY